MSTNFLIKISNKKTIILSNSQLNIAEKVYLTHDLEAMPYKMADDNNLELNTMKCKKCSNYFTEYKKFPKVLFVKDNILYLSCEQIIIKGLLE